MAVEYAHRNLSPSGQRQSQAAGTIGMGVDCVVMSGAQDSEERSHIRRQISGVRTLPDTGAAGLQLVSVELRPVAVHQEIELIEIAVDRRQPFGKPGFHAPNVEPAHDMQHAKHRVPFPAQVSDIMSAIPREVVRSATATPVRRGIAGAIAASRVFP